MLRGEMWEAHGLEKTYTSLLSTEGVTDTVSKDNRQEYRETCLYLIVNKHSRTLIINRK